MLKGISKFTFKVNYEQYCLLEGIQCWQIYGILYFHYEQSNIFVWWLIVSILLLVKERKTPYFVDIMLVSSHTTYNIGLLVSSNIRDLFFYNFHTHTHLGVKHTQYVCPRASLTHNTTAGIVHMLVQHLTQLSKYIILCIEAWRRPELKVLNQ